jgi:hypothetical protein
MLYWISFASETAGCLGVAIVEANSLTGAVKEATRRGINPGGQAAVFECPTAHDRQMAWPYRNRLLSRDEAVRIFGPPGDANATLEAAGDRAAVICDHCNEP